MIHVTRSYRPEIVLFGRNHPLAAPFVVEAGKQILVTANGPEQATVSKFAVNQPDQKRVVALQADEVIRAIVELGGTYPDVVQALQQAKAKGALLGRFEVDALPRAGRRYYRDADGKEQNADPNATEESSGIVVSNPTPELFNERFSDTQTESKPATAADASTAEEPEKRRPIRAFFDRMVGRGE
jgi:hypothetical protein